MAIVTQKLRFTDKIKDKSSIVALALAKDSISIRLFLKSLTMSRSNF